MAAKAAAGVLVVRDAEALRRLKPRGVRRVRLEIAGLDGEDSRRREVAINRQLGACGCEWSAAAGGLAAIGGAAWPIWRSGGPLAVPWNWWLAWLLLTGAALGAGKAFGLWLSGRRLRREITALQQAAMHRQA